MRRLEVLRLRLNMKKGFNPCDFKGRILVADRETVQEIYNGKTGAYLIMDKEQNTGDYVGYNPFHRDEEGIQNSDGFQDSNSEPKTENNSGGQIDLLLTGPEHEVGITDLIVLLVHTKDIVDGFDNNADSPNAYADFLTRKYIQMGHLLPYTESDGVQAWQPWIQFNKIFSLTADCDVCSVTLDFIMYMRSMAVTVEVFLINYTVGDADGTDIKISGKLSVCSGQSVAESLLFWKTPDQAILVKPGKALPLSRKLVAVDFELPFTVHADLFGPGCIVKGDAEFVVDDYKDFKGKVTHTCIKTISGEHGKILVKATGKKMDRF